MFLAKRELKRTQVFVMFKLGLLAAVSICFVVVASEARLEQAGIQSGKGQGVAESQELVVAQTSTRLRRAPDFRDPWAGEAKAPDVIWLFDPRDEARETKKQFFPRYVGPVKFNHNEHVLDARLRCNSCHHDYRAHRMETIPRCNLCHHKETGVRTQPRNKCVICHKTPGVLDERGAETVAEWDSGMKAALQFLGDSFHKSCDGCHHEANIEAQSVSNPVSCRSCHLATEVKYLFKEQ